MSFSVASYNVLADSYVKREWYPAVPAALLAPGTRTPGLVRHIEELGADVVCLQEVEPAVFTAVRDRLGPLGYDARYARKGAGKPDGCATFVRREVFAVRRVRSLYYADGRGGKPDSGHVALVLALEGGGRRLGLANTHLKWEAAGTPPEARWGYREVAQLLAERDVLGPGCHGWIVCGDFNATPDSAEVRALEGAGFDHAFVGRAGAYTATANRRAKQIDYLFHTRNLRAQPGDVPAIGDDTPLPSAEQPSDHLAILARFEWVGP